MMVTTSTDGAMSVWQMDMLAAPIEQLALTDVSGIDFASSDTFWAGGHDGNVYSGSRVDKAGARAGLGSDRYVGHTSRISALHVHPNFSDIVLTASFDWSVRLFKHRAGLRPSSALVTSDAQNRRLNVRSIHAIDTFSDYVMDAKWSPSHPCVFAAVDAAGSLSLFDLSTNPEVPIESTSINNKSSSLPLAGLNKLAFGNAGRLIATGDTNGIIRTYSLAESLYSSSNDDFLLFTKLINNRI
ncbi:Cytoplasmic dynein 1 intermediate chain 2 [Zancudomyces culisetae]|uniref:Cytoplasmic dynein 1 intermediate chain 2 n=1 Tax=Zancudomyces culisetae TaxID=1213189 RepID=A0A1R1PJP2_ZANCU|nr:Cytoplasmic dynein 1 intermediate chain 2 [Zancudomyces culisetae]|eukprot:OMH81102.1 Cytoplasmic dynein 1 intermediate chain 2 [Zancudomyces culisetae]